MNQRLFVDTNYFCALHNKKDSLHDKAKSIAKSLQQFSLVVSNFILLETYTILSQRVSKEYAIKFHRTKVAQNFYQIIWIDKQFEKEIWSLFVSIKDKNFSYVDASILAVMEKEKIHHLLSFDTSFKNLQKKFDFTLIGE